METSFIKPGKRGDKKREKVTRKEEDTVEEKAIRPQERDDQEKVKRDVCKPDPLSSKFLIVEAFCEKEKEEPLLKAARSTVAEGKSEEEEMQGVEHYCRLVSGDVAHILRPYVHQEEHRIVEREYDQYFEFNKFHVEKHISSLVGDIAAMGDFYKRGIAPPVGHRSRRSLAKSLALVCRTLVDRWEEEDRKKLTRSWLPFKRRIRDCGRDAKRKPPGRPQSRREPSGCRCYLW